MDAGVAGVVAGVAGMVGALGGAVVGGLAAVRGARIGAEKTSAALLKQTQDQAEIEHRHWAREHRRQACSQLMEHYAGMLQVLAGAQEALWREETPTAEQRQTMESLLVAMAPVSRQLDLWGPPELQDAVGELMARIRGITYLLREWAHAVETSAADMATHRNRYLHFDTESAYNAFVATAGEVLRSPA
ncbi:hypothetical protein AB0C77_07795 [Streptomyces sp. NPDC048629]|uniref:hypothetical protein n=1 Tax=Streptomyces sp. NPDC048629 TaxID=3154824 RepID=UPI003447B7D5